MLFSISLPFDLSEASQSFTKARALPGTKHIEVSVPNAALHLLQKRPYFLKSTELA